MESRRRKRGTQSSGSTPPSAMRLPVSVSIFLLVLFSLVPEKSKIPSQKILFSLHSSPLQNRALGFVLQLGLVEWCFLFDSIVNNENVKDPRF